MHSMFISSIYLRYTVTRKNLIPSTGKLIKNQTNSIPVGHISLTKPELLFKVPPNTLLTIVKLAFNSYGKWFNGSKPTINTNYN